MNRVHGAAHVRGRVVCALPMSFLLLVGCARQQSPEIAVRAEPWPEADALFHHDSRWLGADAAFTVPMGDGRVLWLFGDTFVARTKANLHSESAIVRNSIAMQTGSDPTTASISYYWRGTVDVPASYFPEEGELWLWPQHGIRLGRALVLFLSRVRPTPGEGLGFEADGWRVVVIDDASGTPASWTARLVVPKTAPTGIVAGAGLSLVGMHVVSLAVREPGDHAGYLVRWRVDDLGAGRLDEAEWWTAARGWTSAAKLVGAPTVILADAGPESSLHFDAKLRRWVHVRSEGFGATTVVASFAETITGPWSKSKVVYRPPESDRPDAFVYAAKGHPELACADLVVTYASNTNAGFGKLVEDMTIYFPRFVRLTFSQ